MSKCVDCMQFVTFVLNGKHKHSAIVEDNQKIKKALEKEKSIRVFKCKLTGKVYLHNWKTYLMKSCDAFDNANK